MYHKILVKKFVLNKNNEPLKNEDGSIVTEPYKETIYHKEERTDGEGKVHSVVIPEEVTKLREIIPTRVKDTEFIIYQQLENNSIIGLFDEKGNPFEFNSSHAEVYESSVVEENAIPTF